MKKTGLCLLLVAVSGLTFTPFGCLNAATPTPTATPTPAALWEVMTKALEQRNSLPAASGSLWRFEGPTTSETMSQSGNRGSRTDTGRINEIAIDPKHPTTMYVTGATGGVWKTVDGGIIWAARSQGWPVQAATAVAIDPNDSNRVFVGTGDYKRLDWVEPFSVGIMRSLDGGLTWTNVGSREMGEFTVSRIVVDRHSKDTTGNYSRTIFAATGRGSRLPGGQIFRSKDGGETWARERLPNANWDDLELSSNGTLWASATRRNRVSNMDEGNNLVGDPLGKSGLVYQLLQGETTWKKVNVRNATFDLDKEGLLDTPPQPPDTIQIACPPGSPLVYVAVYSKSEARVFVSPDKGATWSEMTGASNYPVPVGENAWAHAGFGATASFVYVGGVDMYSQPTSPSGAAYSQIAQESHASGDFQCVVAHPIQTENVYLGADGGIYLHSQTLQTTDLNNTLGVTQIFRMDVHPRNGGLIALGTQDNGNWVNFYPNVNDVAIPVRWRKLGGGDGRSVAFRQDDSSRVYLANTHYNVSRYDGTVTPDTALLTNGASLLVALGNGAQSPLLYSNDRLYSARRTFSWLQNPESKNRISADWESVEFATPRPAQMQSLAFCPSNPQVIYAASQIGELFRSTNGGQSWAPDRTGLPTKMPIWAISPSRSNCGDVLVAVGYGQEAITKGENVFSGDDSLLYKANALADGDWSGRHGVPPSLPHAPLYAIARLRSAPASKWFVAGDVGVFRTDDSGDHWANATAPLGLPNTLVRDLRLSFDGNTLYAGTFGRGVWSMDVNPPPDHFGVRGTVTRGGGPVSGIKVRASGGGRIKRFLKNTLTTGPTATTAPIVVREVAKISGAAIHIVAINAKSAVLVTPLATPNAELEMTLVKTLPLTPEQAALLNLTPEEAALLNTFGGTSLFSLPNPSELVGKSTEGSWSFRVTGVGEAPSRLSPSIVTGFVDLSFQEGVSGVTGQDGEFTLEYLNKDVHKISAFQVTIGDSNCEPSFGASHCQLSVDLQSNRTGLDFRRE